jgi:monoamine oxidase
MRRHSCNVAVVGAGLSGLYAARLLAAAGVDVLVLEAQGRVGGRTLTGHFDDGTFVDDGGQWVSPGQDRIVALAQDLQIGLFDSWADGRMVIVRDGVRSTGDGPFSPGDNEARDKTIAAAQQLAAMAADLAPDAPWTHPQAQRWDATTLHQWLAENVGNPWAERVLANAIEGVFAHNATPTSLLAALFWARSGDPLVPFLAKGPTPPERRFVGGAQQLCEKMAAALGDRVLLGARVTDIAQRDGGIEIGGADCMVRAERAIVTLPPATAGRIRYAPGLPAQRDHLCQRAPMRWVVKVHCVYPDRFWAVDGLSGATMSDDGIIRITADNSPPSGAPGILVGFIEETEALRLASAKLDERRAAVIADLVRYFGARAAAPLDYREKHWGDDPFCRGVDGGYWSPGTWTAYGAALRRPIGRLHWAGTETSAIWNGKMEGALLAADRAATNVLVAGTGSAK